MEMSQYDNWLSTDVQAHIGPPSILLIKVELEEESASNTIKVKIWRNPSTAMSETYNINMYTFKYVQPEEFLTLLKNFIIAIDGTGTTSWPGRINYICTILCGEARIEFNELASQNSGTKNAHLKHITEGLLGYFSQINSLSKQKRAMRRANA